MKKSPAKKPKPLAVAEHTQPVQTALTPGKAAALMALPLRAFVGFTWDDAVRWVILFFAATLPLYYDLAVPEVSGDIRWAATFVFAGLAAVLYTVGRIKNAAAGPFSLKAPLHLWVALGLAIWAAVSLIDALNWMRGIILLKALYAQLLLMFITYRVATPAFVRRLLWALVLPLVFTSFLGIAHFEGWNDESFANALAGNWLFLPLQPLFALLDWLAGLIAGWMGWGNRGYGFIGLITNYFMQSAPPGSTFANKNLAGSWTAMMLPLAFYLLLTAKRIPGQAWASLLLSIGFLFLIYSRARASWLAVFAALATLIVLVAVVPAWRKAVLRHVDKKHAIWLLLPILVCLRWGGEISPLNGTYAVNRSPGQQVAALAQSSWDEIGGRLAYNLNSLAITKDYWFNGVGLGSFYVIYPPYSHKIVPTPPNSYSVMARPQRTHTDLMQAFDEMGIPGGLLYAGLFIGAIAMAFRMAGKRAGAVGGTLVATGCTGGILALGAFLEHQEMVYLPTPWNFVFYGIMGAITAWFGVRFVLNVRAVQAEPTPADDIQLLGFMAGISLLTISLNALMDFPMQLPTAPAAAALVMGGILALYMRQNPKARVGISLKSVISRPVYRLWGVTLLAVLLAAWGWSLVDASKFRQGNVLLKQAMIRIFSGVNDDITLQLLAQAYTAYPLDPRIHEHIGVVVANYTGQLPLTVQDRIDRLDWVLAGDPWGPNHLINAIGQSLQLAESLKKSGKQAAANHVLAKAEGYYTRLQQAADFSQFTWGAGGMLRLMEGKPDEASSMFQRALAIDSNYIPARNGLAMAQAAMGVTPVMVRDALTGGAGAVVPVSQ